MWDWLDKHPFILYGGFILLGITVVNIIAAYINYQERVKREQEHRHSMDKAALAEKLMRNGVPPEHVRFDITTHDKR